MLDKLKKIYQNGDVSMPSILATTKCSELGDLTLEQAFELYEQASCWAGDSVISCEEHGLPTDMIITNEDKFRPSDEFVNEINEFLCDEYGLCPESYSYEVRVSNISWDTSEQDAYEQDRAWDEMRHGRE